MSTGYWLKYTQPRGGHAHVEWRMAIRGFMHTSENGHGDIVVPCKSRPRRVDRVVRGKSRSATFPRRIVQQGTPEHFYGGRPSGRIDAPLNSFVAFSDPPPLCLPRQILERVYCCSESSSMISYPFPASDSCFAQFRVEYRFLGTTHRAEDGKREPRAMGLEPTIFGSAARWPADLRGQSTVTVWKMKLFLKIFFFVDTTYNAINLFVFIRLLLYYTKKLKDFFEFVLKL